MTSSPDPATGTTSTASATSAGTTSSPALPTRSAYVEMLVAAVLGLVAALVLSIEAVTLAGDPSAALSCDISATISCTKVALSWQASLLGFPNAFLGLIAEPVVITIAVAGLGKVAFPRWFLNAALAVYFIGVVFAYWLFFQSYFVIGALCPWCLLVTVTTTLAFASLLRVCVSVNAFRFRPRVYRGVVTAFRVGVDWWVSVLLVAVLAALVLYRYV